MGKWMEWAVDEGEWIAGNADSQAFSEEKQARYHEAHHQLAPDLIWTGL